MLNGGLRSAADGLAYGCVVRNEIHQFGSYAVYFDISKRTVNLFKLAMIVVFVFMATT